MLSENSRAAATGHFMYVKFWQTKLRQRPRGPQRRSVDRSYNLPFNKVRVLPARRTTCVPSKTRLAHHRLPCTPTRTTFSFDHKRPIEAQHAFARVPFSSCEN